MSDDKVKPLRGGIDGLKAFLRVTSFGGSRDRPFLGQKWTFTGERGRGHVPLTRMRDLGDCIVEALESFPDLERVDLDALAQTVLAYVEHGQFERNRRR